MTLRHLLTVALLQVLASAFLTGVIGVHPIFGAFLAGLMCPHEGGFAIKVTEKVEDLMVALFLPLYFTLSGLSTNLGLLNSGTVWGYVFAVVIVAFTTKFIGCSIAARLNGLVRIPTGVSDLSVVNAGGATAHSMIT